jgi:uncharacterized membrane protein
MTGPAYALALAATLACGLSAGVFFAFSSFVMPALGRLDPGSSVEAMQAINRAAVTPAFMTVLMGGAALCAAVLVVALRTPGAPSSPWVAAGAGVFLAGVLGPTVLRHVPMNDALALVDPRGTDAAARWRDYARPWTALNHLRAAAGTVAAALLAVGMAAG